ncbi:unnamed protein product, partial [Prorocentrum cordatum]
MFLLPPLARGCTLLERLARGPAPRRAPGGRGWRDEAHRGPPRAGGGARAKRQETCRRGRAGRGAWLARRAQPGPATPPNPRERGGARASHVWVGHARSAAYSPSSSSSSSRAWPPALRPPPPRHPARRPPRPP